MILRADDPWWETHYPPNGWGCSCKVFAVGKRELRNRGIDPEELTEGKCVTRDAQGKSHVSDIPYAKETVEWVSRDGTRRETLPRGVQPGWAYNVGKAGAEMHQRQNDVQAEIESQTAIKKKEKKKDRNEEHLASRQKAVEKAGTVTTAQDEEFPLKGIIENVARKISLERFYQRGRLTPDIRNIPEEAVSILNDRIEEAGRSDSRFEGVRIITVPDREDVGPEGPFPQSIRFGSRILRPIREREHEVRDMFRGFTTYNDSPTNTAHSFEEIDETEDKDRPLTTITAKRRLEKAFEQAKNGKATFYMGADGRQYFEAEVDDEGSKALFVAEKGGETNEETHQRQVHWFPVSGSGIFNLTDKERAAVIQMREKTSRLGRRLKKTSTEDEFESCFEDLNVSKDEKKKIKKKLAEIQSNFIPE